MLVREGIDQNLKFLILEVSKQLEQTRRYLQRREPGLLPKIQARDDYIDNLKSIVQRKCFSLAAERAGQGASTVELLKAIDVVAANLERISDFCENIIKQLGYIENEVILEVRRFDEFFDDISAAVRLIEPALFGREVQLALQICRTEHQLDRRYAQAFAAILQELRTGSDTETLVTTLFISHYFERMGDALLNVGEAVISAAVGERIKIDEFQALEDSLAESKIEGDFTLRAMGETRSGCRIDRLSESSDAGRSLIFKEGRTSKLVEEKASIERWHDLMPGLAPRIYSFQQQGENAAILFEYLSGRTFDELLLSAEPRELDMALTRLCSVLETVWTSTRRDEPVSAHFMAQLRKRLDDVYTVHETFRTRSGGIGPISVASFEDLVDRAERLEERLLAPFSVFIHGDLNVDNIIYDQGADEVHFVDLHRSRMMDYVQDVSVFLVSNHRLPTFVPEIRKRISYVTHRFREFAGEFAERVGDTTFTARLALGLARSFATSARFVLDEEFAKSMFLRSRYLLERLLAEDGRGMETFRIPAEALVD